MNEQLNAPETAAQTPATSPATNDGQEQPEAKFTQADIDRILAERLKRERQQAEEKVAREKSDAETKALEEQQKFEQLAMSRKAENEKLAADLKTATEQQERYQKALDKLLKAQRKQFPEPVVELLNQLDEVQQLEWIATNGEKMKSSTAGVPATPKPDGSGITAEQREAARKDANRQLQSIF